MNSGYFAEPFRIRMVEPIRVLSEEERLARIQEAGFNVFNLRAEDVYIDLLTDSGTGAMSARQWAGMMMGDESYSGARSYYNLMDACSEVFGCRYFQPVHQGRAAEKIVMPILLGKGKISIANMHFDTTRAHVEIAGGRAIDCVVPEAEDTSSVAPFKGNMDIGTLRRLVEENGKEKVGVVIMTITNNSAGGQPVSMENIRETSKLCNGYGIPFMIDAARFAENAFFIKEREPGYQDVTIEDIVRECFSYADLFTMSAKKDAIVNIGGLIGVREDAALFEKVKALTIPSEGFISYGGLAGRDLEAMAIGLKEGIDLDYLRYRTGQPRYLGERLKEAGIPFQSPAGGHAIFVDAGRLLPHIPYNEFPAQALAIELYKEAGIRACDIGSFMLGRDPDTREQLKSKFEFTRLAIPRRVYTQSHIDVVADALAEIGKRADKLRGYRITWEPEVLRHFTARLEPIR
ncbi:tryptophanase [Youngiibacter fragilis]|uniref:Tryptophanase n=1 Tax=Youngiibacter fragilis 232.1 TaxID=994573 RepID=V7I6F3_9CLOT|nr:tryptophanase [Youngiibacter fragilis]ETA80779.1 L-cysteine desulfhydrase [Youngiibacter fragilis 232.1]